MRCHLTLVLLPLALGACGVDNNLNAKDDDNEGFDSGVELDSGVDSDSDPPPPEEECNGLDDDGDGEVDEGFPDADGNGRADCMDQECPTLALGSAGTVAIPEECEGTATITVKDPWNVSVEYRFSSGGASVVMPSIGNLNDDNGDGVVDDRDIPDIAFVSYSSGTLYAVNGDGSGVIFQKSGFRNDGGVVIADVDADGEPEVVGITSSSGIQLLDASGAVEWTSRNFSMVYPVTTVADLDEDGIPEVVADAGVVHGNDGSEVAQLSVPNSYWRSPIAADIDLDGDQEIILSTEVFDSTGTRLWSVSPTGSVISCFGAVANIDRDPEAELFFTCGQDVIITEHDGTEIRRFTASNPYGHPGPPCIADFDGDGDIELGVPGGSTLYLFEVDGTTVWTQPINDSSGAAGCSGYDVNGDGAYEMLFADQDALRIYDGPTGAVVYENTDHGSVTYFEYPVVADVDGDGSAEIIVSASSGVNGVTVYGHNGDGWPQSGPTWPVHDFGVTNVDPDGHVPASPEPTWETYNVFRARPAVDDPSSPDLTVDITDACVADCTYGPVSLALQVSNRGGQDVDAGATVAIYANEGSSTRLVTTLTLPAVPAGTRLSGVELELTPADVGLYGFRAVVDDDGTGLGLLRECDEDNNVDDYADAWCP